MNQATVWTLGILAGLLLVGVGRMMVSARPGSEEFASSVHSFGNATLGTIWDWRAPAEMDPDQQLEGSDPTSAYATIMALPRLAFLFLRRREISSYKKDRSASPPKPVWTRPIDGAASASSLGHWLPGPLWISRSMAEWLMHDGPTWSIGICLPVVFILLIWRKPFSDSSGQLLVASIVAVAVFANVWVWVEPRNYISSRPTQVPLETYIRSIDDYYAPIEADVEQELARYREPAIAIWKGPAPHR